MKRNVRKCRVKINKVIDTPAMDGVSYCHHNNILISFDPTRLIKNPKGICELHAVIR